MQTERVTFLTTPDHKAALDAFAKQSGVSVGHVLREATNHFMSQPTPEAEEELAALVEQVNEAIPQMRADLDSMIETLRATNDKVDKTLREAGIRT